VKLRNLPISQITVVKNVRSETEDDLGGLMESIGKYDVIQPVLVVPRGDNQYELIAGHRRLAACKSRNERTIPAVIRDDIDDADIPYLKLVENVQRRDMSCTELVKAFEAIRAAKPGISLSGIGRMLGKTQTWVSDQYRSVETMGELRAAGMTEEDVRAIPKSELKDLYHVKDQAARLQLGKDLSDGSSEARKALKRKQRKGPYVDRSGGFSILTAPGSNTIRLVCDSAAVRDQVVGSILNLKRRRISGARK
jgi:ParB/RepB/Spo0J family partition protein